MILLAVLAQGADALTFVVMVSTFGMAAEMNGLVHLMGPGTALVAKAGLVAYLAALAVVLPARYSRPVLALAFLAGIVGAASNLWTLGA